MSNDISSSSKVQTSAGTLSLGRTRLTDHNLSYYRVVQVQYEQQLPVPVLFLRSKGLQLY
jgi:hypothetical protein